MEIWKELWNLGERSLLVLFSYKTFRVYLRPVRTVLYHCTPVK